MNQTSLPPLVSGKGQFHTNEPDPKKPKKLLTPYLTIISETICHLVDHPQQVDKTQAQWVIATTLPSRNFKEQEQHGEYWMMWADLDDHPPSLPDLVPIVDAILGGCDFESYNSRSATAENQKARLLIYLDKPLCFADWRLAQEILNDKFAALGIEPDRANQRAAQLCYLPNRGVFYGNESKRTGNIFNPLEAWHGEIMAKRDAIEVQQIAMETAKQAAMVRRQALSLSAHPSIYEAFNAAYTPQDLLLKAGYDQRGDSFRHPNSETGNYSASVRFDDAGVLRVHTLSTADPLNTNGAGAHDAFSTFCTLFHGGDTRAAKIDAGDNLLAIGVLSYNKAIQIEHERNKAAQHLETAATPSQQPQHGERNPPDATLIDYSTMPIYGGHTQTEPAPFQLVQIKSLIDNPIPIRWTIKGFLEKGGMNLISGPYGSGKSFVVFDMSFCVAAGINWIGNKVIQSPVIILAGEGHSGIADRFAALELKYGVSCPDNLYVSKIPARLTDGVNADWVNKAVNQLCPEAGLIIVDTLNRNFGGLDENSTKDMTLFINNVDNIFRATGKTVSVVHHTGHAETNRARGNSSLPGACEGEFIVKGQDKGLILICEKQKNAPKAAPIQFKFKRIEIPGRVDDEGESVSSLVLECDGEATPDTRRIRLSGRDDLILTSLSEAITEHGVEPGSEIKEKFGGFDSLEGKCKKVVHIDYWRARAYPVIDAESMDSKIKAFKRTRGKLVDVGKVRCWDDYWWYL